VTPLVLDVALTHLAGRRRQTLVSVVGVALGVGFFIGMASLMQGFQTFFRNTVIDVAPHVTVGDEVRRPAPQPARELHPDAAVAVAGVRPEDERRGIRRGLAIAAALDGLPGVAAAPSLQTQLILRYGGAERTASVLGIEPDREARVTRIEDDMVAGGLGALRVRSDGAILGAGLAARLGVGMGDAVDAASARGVTRRLTVVGLFRTGIASTDDGLAYVRLREAQVLADRPTVVNQIRVRLDEPQGAQAFAAWIEDRTGWKSVSWQEANRNIFNVFVIQNGIMYSTVGAIMVVASFGIFNVISTVVFEKSRDIAILKSLGFREGDIRRVFLIEGMIVGAIGAVAGWLVGWAIVEGLGMIRFEFGGEARFDRFLLHRTWVHYAVGGVFAVVSAGFAGWLPARRAAALDPVDVVRGAA
jgi:lipoprotein-releasing system permease protein